MKIPLISLLLIFALWSCRQTAKVETQEPQTMTKKITFKVPSVIKELAEFCDLQVSDSTDVNDNFSFFLVNSNGVVEPASMVAAVDSYKALIRSGAVTNFPVFEIQNTPNAILTVAGKGYGGMIWGTFLVNKNTFEVSKVAFEHKAESEGYGTGISLSTFEDQFVGATIRFEENTYGMNQDGKTVIPGTQSIDGISGATVTYKAVVDMVNEGLKKYDPYLNGQQTE